MKRKNQFKNISAKKVCKCVFCHRDFANNKNLQVHIRTHTGEKPYKCKVCRKEFSQLANLQAHLRTHTGERPYKCEICSKDFRQLSNLQAHTRTHTGEKPYKCQLCEKEFTQLSNLQGHCKTHTREKLDRCKLRDKQSKQTLDLQKRTRSRKGEKLNRREFSHRKCTHDSSLQIHSEQNPCSSEFCKEIISKTLSLSADMSHQSSQVPKKEKLGLKLFSQKCHLQKHNNIVTHAEKITMKWKLHEKKISVSKILKTRTRIRIHCEEQQHMKSPSVDRALSQGDGLQNNVSSHDGEKNYKPEVCDAVFSQDFHLRMRTRSQNRQKHLCEKTVAIRHYHEAPGRNQTEENPVKCELDEKAVLVTSQPSERGSFCIKYFGCGICGETFGAPRDFVVHCFHHKDD